MAFDNSTNDLYVTTYLDQVVVISGTYLTILARIPVGTYPDSIAYDNLTGDLWVANLAGGPELSVIDGQTLLVVANVSVYASGPEAVGFDYATQEIVFTGVGFTLYGYMAAVYDTNYSLAWGTLGTGYLSVPQNIICDPVTNEIYVTIGPTDVVVFAGGTGDRVATIQVGSEPTGIAYDYQSRTVYVANYGSDTISEISATSHLVIEEIPVLDSPGGVAYVPGSNEVYVADVWSQAVSVINITAAVVSRTIQVSASPMALAEDAALGAMVVVGGDQALAISERNGSILASAGVGLNPEGITYDNQTNELYVTSAGSNTVTVLSGSDLSVMATISVDNYPQGIVYDSPTGLIFVACSGSNEVDVISQATLSVVARITVATGPTGLAVDSALGELFVTEFDSDNVSVISTQSLTRMSSIPLSHDSAPVGITLDPTTNQLYVADSGRGDVSVISATMLSVIDNISIGGAPFDVVFDPNSAQVFVSNGCAATGPLYLCTSNVTVLSTASQEPAGSFVTGAAPLGEALSARTRNVYVANFYSGNLTVLTPIPSPTYSISFDESGLASGTTWSVTLNHTAMSSTSTVVTFNASNGMYAFTVGLVSGYTVTPSAGNLAVRGSPVSEAVMFSASSSGGGGSPSGFLGFAGNTGYYLLGGSAVVIVAGLAVALVLRGRRK